MKHRLRILFLIVFLPLFLRAENCSDWFNNLNIKGKPKCESLCRTSPTDMSSSRCIESCTTLCKATSEKNKNDNFYGLTDDEIKFCISNKLACIEAYKLTWSAEKICLSLYPVSDVNDESDACRHYVLSIMLSRSLGSKDAETILNAHENNSLEPENERAMDLANNRLGLLDYQKNKDKFKTDDEIKKSFVDQIKLNKLVILKSKYSNTEKGGVP